MPTAPKFDRWRIAYGGRASAPDAAQGKPLEPVYLSVCPDGGHGDFPDRH